MKRINRLLLAISMSGVITSFLLITAHGSNHNPVHTVQMGETLSEIAYAYGVPIEQLASANNIANRNMLYAGQLLEIPDVYDRPVSGTVGDLLPEQYQPVNPMHIHIVQMGETLGTIADKFSNVTLQDILAANNIFPSQSDYIQAGHRLAIPFQE